MKLKFSIFILSLCFFNFAQAQCGSHKSKNRTVHHSTHYADDIIDVATGNDDFATLVVAVKSAGLVETLQSEGPFTVFAPVNSAFSKLPEGTVESLLQAKNRDQLTKVLTYHVVAGEFTARDVIAAIKSSSSGKFEINSVSGDTLTARLAGDSVILTDENGNSSAVIKTDVDASNGVIHVIDSVVLPK